MGAAVPHRRSIGSDRRLGRTPRPPSWWARALWGTGAPISAGPPAGGTGSRAPAGVATYGAPVGDSGPHRCGPTIWGDGKSCPGGGRCLLKGLRGTAISNAPGPPAQGTGSPAQVAVGAHGGPVGDSGSQRPGPTSRGHGESCPGGGRYLWRASGGRQFPTARAHQPGGGEPCQGGGRYLWRAYGGRQLPTARAHQLGGRGVLSRRRPVPMEGLRGTAAPNGPGPPAGGTGSPVQAAAGTYGGPAGDGSSQRLGPTSWGDGESCQGSGPLPTAPGSGAVQCRVCTAHCPLSPGGVAVHSSSSIAHCP